MKKSGIKGQKCQVVGNLMTDEFSWGDVTWFSPEFPGQIVGVKQETLRLGGAASVAHNAVVLVGAFEICSVISCEMKEFLNPTP